MARKFTSYTVNDTSVVSYESVRVEAPFSARATAPDTYAFPTLSDPNGSKRLVRITTGPFAGTLVSPDDPGVVYDAGE